MAVMQNSIIFGGVDSADFGIYIGGEGTFDAPKRDVEMISIPGRNGAFALDKGRFQNIEVTYSAFNHEPDLATFSAQLEGFRNAICSQKGYQRLTDTFHPDEYRMAAYIDGLEIKPIEYNTAATFDIKFDCKPQRYLLSGEEPITIGEWHETETASGTIASFEAKAGDAVKSLVVDIEPTQSGSGTPSPTNIRPISGYDSVVVSRCGKNIANELHHGNISGAGAYGAGDTRVTNATSATSSIIKVTAGQYTLSAQGLDYCTALTKDNNGNIVDNFAGSWHSLPYTFTVTDEAWLYFTCGRSDNASITLADVAVQVEKGSTVTAYEPYNGNTYTISLNGTRYGGTLDVVSGVLTVTHATRTFDGTENWRSPDSSGICWLQDNTLKRSSNYEGVIIASTMPAVRSRYALRDSYECGISGYDAGQGADNYWYIKAPNQTTQTATALKAWLQANNAQVCYELATPTTVQLTAQEVELLVGLNQVWANSGDVSVEYGTAPNVLINPTLFESSPMLEVEGYGNIQFNGYEIELSDGPMGDTVVREKTSYSNKPRLYSDTFEITSLMANSGDNGTIGTSTYIAYCPLNYRDGDSYSIGNTTVSGYTGATAVPELIEGNILRLTVTIPNAPFVVGTNFNNHGTVTQHITRTRDGVSEDGQFYFGFGLRQRDNAIRWNVGNFDELTTTQVFKPTTGYCGCTEGAIVINSTVSILGQPTYIDCDLGEAYKMSGEDIFSLNPYIDLGSDLPKFASGANTITADNTVTDLKVIPRWWKI